jgi:hypothetical protein
LGIVLWQCIALGCPLGKRYEDTNDNEAAAEEFRQTLRQAYVPFQQPDGPELQQLYVIVKGCWHWNAVLRPSAATLANRLLDHLVRLGSTPPSSPNAGDLVSNLRRGVSDRIKECRLEKKKRNPNPKPFLITEIDDLVSKDNNAYDWFLKGAAILWGLVDYESCQSLESASTSLGREGQPNPVYPIFASLIYSLEKRAKLALRYLHHAADNGCVSAYEELSHAYKCLSKGVGQDGRLTTADDSDKPT